MENKKSLTTLLIVLAIVLVGGGLYLFFLNSGFEISTLPWFKKNESTAVSQMQQIEAAKKLTEQNLEDFVKSSRLDDLVGSQQYQDLQDTSVSIDIDNPGNPQPFITPPSTEPIMQPGT